MGGRGALISLTPTPLQKERGWGEARSANTKNNIRNENMSPRRGSCSNDSLLASDMSPLRGLMKGLKNHFFGECFASTRLHDRPEKPIHYFTISLIHYFTISLFHHFAPTSTLSLSFQTPLAAISRLSWPRGRAPQSLANYRHAPSRGFR